MPVFSKEARREEAYLDLLHRSADMPVIDGHEHMPSEAKRLKKNVAFSDLFAHYCPGDMIAGGMTRADHAFIYDENGDVGARWARFDPFYQRIKNGGYARAARIAMARFYGCDDLRCEADAIEVTRRMREANRPGLYQTVFRDACHLEHSMVFTNEEMELGFFQHVWVMEHFLILSAHDSLEKLTGDIGGPYADLASYEAALRRFVEDKVRTTGIRGIKFPTAYWRDLDFTPPAPGEAEAVYRRVYEAPSEGHADAVPYGQLRPLQNHLVHSFVRMAEEFDIPVVFHTGIQAGNFHRLDDARPERLHSLFEAHPDVRFNLLHVGLPWMNETILLAKYFYNVYVDLAWVHAISPELAKTFIKNYIDLAPCNKLTGFGGDYSVAEKVYGHLTLARENIATALAERVADGTLTMADAARWQQAMLYDNPKELYRL